MVALPALVLIEFWTIDVSGFLGVPPGIVLIGDIPLVSQLLALAVDDNTFAGQILCRKGFRLMAEDELA